jgi:hypothetical protein
MPSRPKVCGDAAEGGQEPLRMPQRCRTFHRVSPTTSGRSPRGFAVGGPAVAQCGAGVKDPRIYPTFGRRLASTWGVGAELLCIVCIARLPEVRSLPGNHASGKERCSVSQQASHLYYVFISY